MVAEGYIVMTHLFCSPFCLSSLSVMLISSTSRSFNGSVDLVLAIFGSQWIGLTLQSQRVPQNVDTVNVHSDSMMMW